MGTFIEFVRQPASPGLASGIEWEPRHYQMVLRFGSARSRQRRMGSLALRRLQCLPLSAVGDGVTTFERTLGQTGEVAGFHPTRGSV
jgi:hypothetical protein